MLALFTLIYIILLIVMIVLGGFVAYHLITYTIHRPTGIFLTLSFTIITIALIGGNIALFFSLPLEAMTFGPLSPMNTIPSASPDTPFQ